MKKQCIAVVALLLAGVAVGSQTYGQDVDVWQQYRKQQEEYQKGLEEYKRQQAQYQKRMAEHQKLMEEDTARRKQAWETAEKQQKIEGELQARFEKILDKWEEQAKRYDRILDAMEKKYEVKTDE
jgi:septal ring factor EnvC (AmiA/AmiB activator)